MSKEKNDWSKVRSNYNNVNPKCGEPEKITSSQESKKKNSVTVNSTGRFNKTSYRV